MARQHRGPERLHGVPQIPENHHYKFATNNIFMNKYNQGRVPGAIDRHNKQIEHSNAQ